MTSRLLHRGFLSLLGAQFCGAVNDNVLKQILVFMVGSGLWMGVLGKGGAGYVALCLTVPFILISGFAGQVADRHSKQKVMFVVKVSEMPIAMLAGLGFYLQNLWLTLAAFLLLATQSSFFGPAKYGVIPELVERSDLSRANGTINMLTNIAVIMGTIIGGPLADMYYPRADPSKGVLWAPGVALVSVAVIGFLSILPMQKLPAADPNLRYDYNPFSTYIRTLRAMKGKPIFMVALAWSFFYLVGMMAILLIAKYDQVLGISYAKVSYLLGVLGVSIGLGSAFAGFISGGFIRPRLVPVGGIGLIVAFIAMGIVPPAFWNVAVLLFVAGVFAGLYIVPLQALLQRLSPDGERGQFLGTTNALSFCFSSIGALIYLIASGPLSMKPNRVFLICGVLMLGWVVFAMIHLRGYMREHAKV